MDGSIMESLANFADDLAVWWNTIHTFAYVLGFGLAVFGLAQIGINANKSKGLSGSLSGIAPLIFGSLMLALPAILDIATYSLFKSNAPTEAMAYMPPGAGDEASAGFKFAIVVIHLVGVYAIIRGLHILSMVPAGSRGVGIGTAFIHFVGGALALRIDKAATAIGISSGGFVESVIDKFF